MIYLSDEEQEIFDEGFGDATTSPIVFCGYCSGTLGYELWWKGFCSALRVMLKESENHLDYLEFLRAKETYAF